MISTVRWQYGQRATLAPDSSGTTLKVPLHRLRSVDGRTTTLLYVTAPSHARNRPSMLPRSDKRDAVAIAARAPRSSPPVRLRRAELRRHQPRPGRTHRSAVRFLPERDGVLDEIVPTVAEVP